MFARGAETKTQTQPSGRGTMTSVNGPPIRQRVRDLENGWRIRESYGDSIRRFDVHTGDGWHDFAWWDLESKQIWNLKDAQGNVKLAALGKSEWAGKGPAVPAERGCVECHAGKISPATADDPEFQAAVLMQLIALRGGDKRYSGGISKPTPTPVSQPGPAGPAGRDGKDGRNGVDGKDADNDLIIRTINESMSKTVIAWLNDHKSEFRGADGKPATIKIGSVETVHSGFPARVRNSGTDSEAVFEFEIPRGRDGVIDETKITELKKEISALRGELDSIKNQKATFALLFVDASGGERKRIEFSEKEPGSFVATVPPLDAIGIDLSGKEERTWFTYGAPLIIKNRAFSAEEIKAIAKQVEKAK